MDLQSRKNDWTKGQEMKHGVLLRTFWGREDISMSYESDSGDGKWADADIWGLHYQDLGTDSMWGNREMRESNIMSVESTDRGQLTGTVMVL